MKRTKGAVRVRANKLGTRFRVTYNFTPEQDKVIIDFYYNKNGHSNNELYTLPPHSSPLSVS